MTLSSFFTYSNIDFHSRLNPVFEKIDYLKRNLGDQSERIVKIAIPFLLLYTPFKNAIITQLSLFNGWQTLFEFQKADGIKIKARQAGELILIITTATLQILNPAAAGVFGEFTKTCHSIYGLGTKIETRQSKIEHVALTVLSLVHSGITVSALVVGTPEIIMISLVAQGAFEFYKAYNEYKQGRQLEAIANIALGILRIIPLLPLIQYFWKHGRTLWLLKHAVFNDPTDDIFFSHSDKNLVIKEYEHDLQGYHLAEAPNGDLTWNKGAIKILEIKTFDNKQAYYYARVNKHMGRYEHTHKLLPLSKQIFTHISTLTGVNFHNEDGTLLDLNNNPFSEEAFLSRKSIGSFNPNRTYLCEDNELGLGVYELKYAQIDSMGYNGFFSLSMNWSDKAGNLQDQIEWKQKIEDMKITKPPNFKITDKSGTFPK